MLTGLPPGPFLFTVARLYRLPLPFLCRTLHSAIWPIYGRAAALRHDTHPQVQISQMHCSLAASCFLTLVLLVLLVLTEACSFTVLLLVELLVDDDTTDTCCEVLDDTLGLPAAGVGVVGLPAATAGWDRLEDRSAVWLRDPSVMEVVLDICWTDSSSMVDLLEDCLADSSTNVDLLEDCLTDSSVKDLLDICLIDSPTVEDCTAWLDDMDDLDVIPAVLEDLMTPVLLDLTSAPCCTSDVEVPPMMEPDSKTW